MPKGAITSYIDVAQVVLYAFWIFFAGLVFYLRREDRREGYPLESETHGGLKGWDWLFVPSPKTFLLADGSTVLAPRPHEGPTGPLKAVKREPWPGAPIEPTAPDDTRLGDGVGPGAYAQRAERPDLTWEGKNRIVPLRVADEFTISASDPDPRGMPVLGADREVAGTVTEIWVDRGESLPRYYEVELAGARDRTVLVPVPFADVQRGTRRIVVEAVLARQFAGVPQLRDPDSITLREEDRIMAYFGAGTLYATLGREEPLL
ncbi:MAG: photosynthetic reaction center subunit H [Methylobacterium frigidaeris]